MALVICGLATPIWAWAETENSLFPSTALRENATTIERYEPANAYDPISPSAAAEFEPRRLNRGSREGASKLHPFSNSHNLEWIEASRRGELGQFDRSSTYAPIGSDAPSYQVWEKQQHHGRSNLFGFNNAFSTPGGFGHGGIQNQFSRSAFGGHGNGQPNVQVGPLAARFTGYGSAEWFDRLPSSVIGQSDQTEIDDGYFILSGGLETAATIQVTERGTLDFNLGVGFDYYPDGRPGTGEDLDVQLLPNSYASYEFGVGDAQFSIYDRFARFRNRSYSYYSLDPLDYADYQDHAIGLTVRLPLNDRLSAEGGYEFGQIDSLGDGGQLLDRDTQNVFGSLTYSPDGAWQVGIQASASTFDYSFAGRPDGSSQTVGVFGNLPLSDYTRVSASAGVHRFEFDSINSFADSESLESDYWNLAVENDLNDRLTHSVTFGSGASIGTSSNYVETQHARYQARWRVMDSTVITGGVSFLRNTESGGVLAEEIDTAHYSIGLRHELTAHTSIGANYTKSLNVSDLAQRDYDQQRLQVYCDVELNEKLNLRMSYQNWNVSAQTDAASFEQNSASIGLTYHF